MREKLRYVIGIDPDIEKSGFAVLDVAKKSFERIESRSFSDLIFALNNIGRNNLKGGVPTGIVVVIEDSDDTTNWHLPDKASPRAAAAIGHKVGLCHATQRHIKEWAERLRFEVELIRPLKKTWLGRDGKITQEEMMQFVPGLPKQTNQEGRDAALLAWCYAELPIFIPADFYKEHLEKRQTRTSHEKKAHSLPQRMSAEEFKSLGYKNTKRTNKSARKN